MQEGGKRGFFLQRVLGQGTVNAYAFPALEKEYGKTGGNLPANSE